MQKIAIVGAGLIGRAWAMVFARAGHPVALHDADPGAIAANLAAIDASLADLAGAGLIDEPPTADRAKSEAAFRQIASVLRSPRCMNCHTVTEFPRQGDERRRHDQLVMRGAANMGAPTMQCFACHQTSNSPDGSVPGAPNWHLAPLSMGWEKLSDKELCNALVDKKKNGNRDTHALVEHMTHDALVQWAWAPGGNRTLPRIGQQDFHAVVRSLASTGAACPEK